MEILQAPFPYFGGKSKISSLVWARFGQVRNYVEPFCGSAAMLLNRPEPHSTETINDADGYVSNFWRALKLYPERLVGICSWPVSENDLHARHVWIRETAAKLELPRRLEGDPYYCNVEIAGWWCWGQCIWIGGGWTSCRGPWSVDAERRLIKGNAGVGVKRQRPHLSHGVGVQRKRPHLGDAGRCTKRSRPLLVWFRALAHRLQRVRVCCGDWSRVCGPCVTTNHGLTAVFFDPPYAVADRDQELYAIESNNVSKEVYDWCLKNENDPKLRIALCGYDNEHSDLPNWEKIHWKTPGGYLRKDSQGSINRSREVIWFSPNCLKP